MLNFLGGPDHYFKLPKRSKLTSTALRPDAQADILFRKLRDLKECFGYILKGWVAGI
jgi:hypothetical protein